MTDPDRLPKPMVASWLMTMGNEHEARQHQHAPKLWALVGVTTLWIISAIWFI